MPSLGALRAAVSPDLSSAMRDFVRYRREHLTGDEKGEGQIFLEHLFQAFGHAGLRQAGASLEARLRRRSGSQKRISFADCIWKPRVLIEMKKAREPLARHYEQALENWFRAVPDRPRYIVLCNFDEFWIYDFNHQLEEPLDRLRLEELPRRWEALAFLLPEEAPPTLRNDLVAVTRGSAARVSAVFNHLVDRGTDRLVAQRFVLQCVMAMFAEDIGLLPAHLFTHAVTDAANGGSAYDLLFGLFREMNSPGVTPGGRYVGTPYFNGGLYHHVFPVELEKAELELLLASVVEDWSLVRPAIFGTLFEQSLGKAERHAYGAHFTSELDVMKVVRPTIVEPYQARIEAASSLAELGRIEQELIALRILDPACGSGNFLYLAYRALRKLEKRLQERQDELRRGSNVERMQLAFVSAMQFHGIDINPFAVEIAKATLMLARKLAADELGDERPVLPLDNLDANFIVGDALDVAWPRADVIIGNPPFLGRNKVVEERGAAYAAWLAQRFPGVGDKSNYVVYWFRRAHELLPSHGRAGLVGTSAIRRGTTGAASLDYVVDHGGVIYDAVQSQRWSGEAAVTVSIVNWTKQPVAGMRRLWLAEGTVPMPIAEIPSSLSPTIDLRSAKPLRANAHPKVCFQGQTPGHHGFVLSPDEARDLVARDPASRAVVQPYLIGDELTGSGVPERFVIDIDAPDAMTAAAVAPAAFQRIRQLVLPERQKAAEEEQERNQEVLRRTPKARVNRHHRQFLAAWWQHSYRRSALLAAIEGLPRYIAVSRVASEHRLPIFSFVSPEIRPGDATVVFASADDYSLGILQSATHFAWFRERCSHLETRPRYTSKAVFDSFPWPQAPAQPVVERVVEVVSELLAFRAERMAQDITIGQQYDSLRQPGRGRLRDLHEALDRTVLDVYGFDPDEDLLAQILALNLSLAEQEQAGGAVRGPGPQGLANTTQTIWRIEPIHWLM
jgi:methylase of polypeptide subunit release factors